MKSIAIPIVAILICLTTLTNAAKAPVSQKILDTKSSHIFKGEVISIVSETKKKGKGAIPILGVRRDKHFTITIKVTSVTKGKGLKKGDQVVVDAWQPASPRIGLQGHESIPKKGNVVTIYVESKSGKAYEPFIPNGIKIEK